MSQFSTGFRTMERRQKESEGNFSDSETLLQSEPSSPEIWQKSTRPHPSGTNSLSRQTSTQTNGTRNGDRVHFSDQQLKRGPSEVEEAEQGVSVKDDFPDWRRSAVLTVFIFPPTGLVAMVLACLSQRSAKKGDMSRARRLNCCSCWLVFISLLASLFIILFIILARLYGYIEDPFG